MSDDKNEFGVFFFFWDNGGRGEMGIETDLIHIPY
jgi:hypothetical protein